MTGSCSFGRKGHLLIGLLSVSILFASCWSTHMNQIKECVSVSARPCMNVTGSVLGKINENTTVALYKAEGLDYESIIGKINQGRAERVSKIDANQSFSFFCMPEGRYLLKIPLSSYNFSFGSPTLKPESTMLVPSSPTTLPDQPRHSLQRPLTDSTQ